MMIKNWLPITLLTLLLTACGGSDGGDTTSKGNTTTPDTGTTTPTDSAPTLVLNNTSIDSPEFSSYEVSFTASDKDGDAITITATEDSDFISVSTTSDLITIITDDAPEDSAVIITVTATANGKSISETLTVNVVDANGTAEIEAKPEVVFTDLSQDQSIGSETVFGYVVVLSDNAESFTISADYDAEALGVTFNTELKEMTLTPVKTGETALVVNVTDNLGNSVSEEFSINITALNNSPPELNLAGSNDDNVVTVYANTDNEILVGLYDADGDDVIWQVSSLTVRTYDEITWFLKNYHYDSENNKIKLELLKMPLNEEEVLFDLKMAFTDGTETITKDYVLSMVLADNNAPIFKFEGQVNKLIPIEVGSTKTVKYTLLDDEPEKVNIVSVSFWSGDESLYTVAIDEEKRELYVSHNGTEVGDQVGISLNYKDQSSEGSINIEVLSTVVWGPWQIAQMEYLQDIRQQVAATTEYSYLAEFYADVLENTGVITEETALKYKRAALSNDGNSEYNIMMHAVNSIDTYVKLGWYDESGDEVEATKSTIRAYLPTLLENKGKENAVTANALAALSSGLLPNIPFKASIDKYDIDNGYYSHFTNDSTYGELNGDGIWVFNDTYRFLQAIIEKSRAQVEEIYTPQ